MCFSFLSQAQVNCGATYTINNNTQSSTIPPAVWSNNIIFYVNGIFEINSTLQIIGKELRMAPGAEIRVVSGGFLIAHLTYFRGCTAMWRSINVVGGNLSMSSSYIYDANYGVENNVNQSGSIVCNTINFINCYYGIYCDGLVTPGISNCKFTGIGALMALYSGQPVPTYINNGNTVTYTMPYVGIFIKNKTWTVNQMSSTQTQYCFFQNLNNGIIAENCQSTLKNCVFTSVRREAPQQTIVGIPEGYGVYAFSSNTAFSTLFLTGMGISNSSLTTFNNCEYPIYTSLISGVGISKAKILNAVTAINIFKSSKIEVYNNYITGYTGILLNNPTKATLVQNNTFINVGTARPYLHTFLLNRFGIITNAPFFPPSNGTSVMYISQNSITMNGLNNFTVGGLIVNGAQPGTQILNNNITLSNINNFDLNQVYGLKADLINGSASYRSLIKNNNIQGPTNYLTSPIISNGIALTLSNFTNVSCNTTDATTKGILIQQVNNDCYINGNNIKMHKYGLFLNSVTAIPSQAFTNNIWLENFNYPNNSARYDLANGVNPPSQFFVNPNIVAGQIRSPQVVTPQGINPTVYPAIGWFDGTFSQAGYNCSMQNLLPAGTTDLDYKTIQREIIASQFNEQMLYNNMMRLYEKLDSFDTLTLAFEHFRDSLYNTNVDKFYSLKKMMTAYYDIDQNTDSIIVSLLNSLETNSINLQVYDSLLYTQMPNTSGYDLLNDSLSLGITDSTLIQYILNFQSDSALTQYILHSIDSIQQLIDADYATLNSIYEDLSVVHKQTLENAMALLEEIIPENMIEENYKTIYTLNLNNMYYDYIPYKTNEIATFEQIAWQCPYTGGPAVLMARGVLNGMLLYYNFNDHNICLNDSINYRLEPKENEIIANKILEAENINIFPNPFTNELHITNPKFENNCIFRIYNAMGILLIERILNSANQNIDLSKLPSGIYKASISNKAGQVIKNQKLIRID